MKVEDTQLPGVKLVRVEGFEDFRGEYVEIYNREGYRKAGIETEFLEDDISTSTRGVLKGIHGDDRTWKLVSCLHGKFYLVVLCCDRESPAFGKWQSFTLSDRNRLQVLVPPRHGNGHLCLSETSIFHYKQSCSYEGSSRQFTVRYDDPRFGVWWPLRDPVISRRDETSTL